MYPLAQSLALPRTLSSARRSLHHLSPATVLRSQSNRLLSPGSLAPAVNSVRYLSEETLKSQVAAGYSSRLTQNEVVYAIQEKLIDFHDFSGLPWWAVIIVSTVAVRSLLIFPLAAHQQYVLARLANLQVEMDTTVKEEVSKSVTKLAAEKQWNAKTSNRHYRQLMAHRRLMLYRKYNCHPLKNTYLVFIQLPVWVAMSSAIRNIASLMPDGDGAVAQAFLEMKASGFFILKDLTVPDATFVLPVLVVVINLIVIQLMEMSKLYRRSILRASIIWLTRIVMVLSLPWIMYVPKCTTLYWLTSALCGLAQNILFIHPKTRKMLRIPHYKALREDPFVYIKNRVKSIYYFFKY